MFDAHHLHVRNVTESVTKRVEVTEKRAPTDESVRLLREMEAEAQKRIVATTRVADMGIECVVHQMEDCLNYQTNFLIVYSLNGNKHRVNFDYEHRSESRFERMDNVVNGLADALAKSMAANLLQRAFRNGWKP